MTKHRLLSFALLLALIPSQPSPAQDNPDQLRTVSRAELDAVKARLAQEKAWNAGSLEDYARAYKDSPTTLFVGPSTIHGVKAMLEEYRRLYPTRESMGTLTYSDLEPHPLDDRFLVLTGRYHIDRNKKSGGNADGFFTLVFEKTEQGWKIVIDHTT